MQRHGVELVNAFCIGVATTGIEKHGKRTWRGVYTVLGFFVYTLIQLFCMYLAVRASKALNCVRKNIVNRHNGRQMSRRHTARVLRCWQRWAYRLRYRCTRHQPRSIMDPSVEN